jgi:hypothetical protein
MSVSPLAHAKQQFVDRFLVATCEITKQPQSPGTLNEATGAVTYPEAEVVYRGPCSVTARLSERNVVEGGAPGTMDESLLKLPADGSPGVRVGHLVTILSDPTDQTLVGVEFTVNRVSVGTTSLTRRVQMVRRQSYPSPLGA